MLMGSFFSCVGLLYQRAPGSGCWSHAGGLSARPSARDPDRRFKCEHLLSGGASTSWRTAFRSCSFK
jgi:hypothetical protein